MADVAASLLFALTSFFLLEYVNLTGGLSVYSRKKVPIIQPMQIQDSEPTPGNEAYNLSRDHKPDLEVERERILKAGGFIHAGRVNGSLNLARAIGDMEFKQNKFLPADKQIVTANPDINVVELCGEDEFVVLACDGIWDCMSNQQLVDFIHEELKSENKLSVVCERVLERCLAPSTAGGEGCDNMTMIIVQFKKPAQLGTSIDEQSSASEDAPVESKPADSES